MYERFLIRSATKMVAAIDFIFIKELDLFLSF